MSSGKLSLTVSASFSCLSSSICTSLCFLLSLSSASLRLVSNSRACCKTQMKFNTDFTSPFTSPDSSCSYLYDAFYLLILSVFLFLRPLRLLETGVVRLAAAAAAAAAVGAPAALAVAVFALETSLQFEFLVKGRLGLTLEAEGCLNSLRGNRHTL